jgi:hypothetical protein
MVDKKHIQPLGLLSGGHHEFRNHVRHTLLKRLGEMQSKKPQFASRWLEVYAYD